MYTVFVILHIICGGIWIALGPAMMVLKGATKRAQGTLGELYLMKASLSAGKVMGNIGGIGILVTGGAITGIASYGWFPFSTLPWLAWKQTIFVVLLIMTFAVMVPLSKKAEKMVGEAMGGAQPSKGAPPALRAHMAKIGLIGAIKGLLVLTNIIHGEWKPSL